MYFPDAAPEAATLLWAFHTATTGDRIQVIGPATTMTTVVPQNTETVTGQQSVVPATALKMVNGDPGRKLRPLEAAPHVEDNLLSHHSSYLQWI